MENHSAPWSFDVSSFMVLIGETEEFNYRLMQRSLLECLTAAPVAGLQSYIRTNYALVEATGFTYFSPRGCTEAPLRNMRLVQSISRRKLLRDGSCKVYQVRSTEKKRGGITMLGIAAVSSWAMFVAILVSAIFLGETTWIGLSACGLLVAWSIILRTGERYCLGSTSWKGHQPDQSDAVFVLGRRNSCFILQGSRKDVVKWTGQGLEQKEGEFFDWLCTGMRIGSLALLLYILVVIPNGTVLDQIAFILLNTMGQINVMLGQNLSAKACLEQLELVEEKAMPSRTHVYAYLLRRFGNGKWVEKADLLPQTNVWMKWKDAIIANPGMDPKELYGVCVDDESARGEKQPIIEVEQVEQS
ncbi:hypothetical protein VTL71DRAFT_2650 [Oculimacula yallundae]|uniref:Uncharacterized protein n=1 Tax=Oculimacula yallundae TaxID=86028 RepID=A0ABR4C9G6_9HELO